MIQSQKNILISLDRQYADGILSGEKKVELRSRRMNLSKNDRVWVYSKLPQGCVVMVASVKAVDAGSPRFLWNQYRDVCGITRKEFFAYFSSVKTGYAISLCKIKRLSSPIPLEKIRERDESFHPPQFSKYIMDGTPLLRLFESRLLKT